MYAFFVFFKNFCRFTIIVFCAKDCANGALLHLPQYVPHGHDVAY